MPSYSINDLSTAIKSKASELGFIGCGITDSAAHKEDFAMFEKWLDNGYEADMAYMRNNLDKRENPALLFEGTQSVICLLHSYWTPQNLAQEEYKISKYAWGEDYHFVLKRKAKEIVKLIETFDPESQNRVFTDSAPVLERSLAQRAGLGWIGKNTCLINQQFGSYTFLTEIFTTVELNYDKAFDKNYCGSCTKCIDACPTGALTAKNVDSSKCISYHTIESKECIPADFKSKFGNYIFGCDICLDACPWNKNAVEHKEDAFGPREGIIQKSATEWEDIDEKEFTEIFRKSAVKRAGISKLKENISFIKDK